MAGQGVLTSMHYFKFFFSCVLAFSVSLLSPMDGDRSVQAGESAQGEFPVQSADMDHHGHAEGLVDMMVPHQKHLGPHMRWTVLRREHVDDAGRADQIVETLRQALAKYKDFRVAMDDGYAPLHPERAPKHYHFANNQRRFLAKIFSAICREVISLSIFASSATPSLAKSVAISVLLPKSTANIISQFPNIPRITAFQTRGRAF
jgi:hypothetical protein